MTPCDGARRVDVAMGALHHGYRVDSSQRSYRRNQRTLRFDRFRFTDARTLTSVYAPFGLKGPTIGVWRHSLESLPISRNTLRHCKSEEVVAR